MRSSDRKKKWVERLETTLRCSYLEMLSMNVDSWTWVIVAHNSIGANIMKMDSIWERLDRGLANNNWFLKFPGTRIYHLHNSSSDHNPLLINHSGLDPLPRKKIFRFEEMWLSDSRCAETIKASWLSDLSQVSDDAILKKIERCGQELTNWNKNVFSSVREKEEVVNSGRK